MKKSKLNKTCVSALALFGFALGLASCKDETSSSSSASSSSSSSSESSEETSSSSSSRPNGNFKKWSNRELLLMNTYCGSPLPYVFSSKPKVEEMYDDSSDQYFLQLTLEGSEFSIKDYYKTLVQFDWNIITTYSGKAIQKNTSGIEYAELTKGFEDAGDGYDMIYFYYPEETDEDGETTPGQNIIRCYADMYGAANKDTTWDDSVSSDIEYVTTTNLPFINLGSVYASYSGDYDSLQIYDKYVKNLTSDYAKLLVKDGFVLNEDESSDYDAYILNKTLADGSTIDALLYFNGGNNFNFYYNPKVKEYSSWPTDVVAEIKEKTGEELPKFDIAEGGKYCYYKKGEIYFIYSTDLSDDFDYEAYDEDTLKNPKTLWNEKIDFDTYDIYDGDEIIGYRVVIKVTTPTSTFSSTYPTSAIADTVTNLLGVSGVSFPTFTDSSIPTTGKQTKYTVRGEDHYNKMYAYYYEDIIQWPFMYGLDDDATLDDVKAKAAELAKAGEGILVNIFDVDMQAYEAYEKILNDAGWYEYYDDYNDSVFEDPTGKIAVTLSATSYPSHDNEGTTTFFFHVGTGEEHEPVFEFQEEEVEIAVGGEQRLYVTKKMLPYEVTYTSSDTTGGISVDSKGNVTVASTVEDGTTAVITASIQVPGESGPRTTTCTVTAKKYTTYETKDVVHKIAAIADDLGYETTITPAEHEDQFDTLEINFGSSMTKEEAKEIVSSKLVLDGFEENWEWDDNSTFIIDNGTPDGIEIECSYAVYELYNASCYILTEYNIYEYNGNLICNVHAY